MLECFCGEDDQDGLMVLCEKCKTWQHAECVNLNKFNIPSKYICPFCQGFIIKCKCEFEADYQKSLVFCNVCKQYMHKRHVGLGLGEIPDGFICPDCNGKQFHVKNVIVEPYISFLPDLNIPKSIKPLSDYSSSFPRGKLADRIKAVNTNSSPLMAVSWLYSNLRDRFFQSHPMLTSMEYSGFNPKKSADDCLLFFQYFIEGVAFIFSIKQYQVVQILDHLINIDIYHRPIPKCFRESDSDFSFLPHKKLLQFSERGQDKFDSKEPIKAVESLNTKICIVPGVDGFKTVIAKAPIQSGELICPVFGNVMVLEEMDFESKPMDHSIFWIYPHKLYIKTNENGRLGIFQHIRRGTVSNVAIRIYELNGTRSIGVFSTGIIPLPCLANKTQDGGYTIKPGEELVLPIDFPPPFIRYDLKWKIGRISGPNSSYSELMRPIVQFEKIIDINESNTTIIDTDKLIKTKKKPSAIRSLFEDEPLLMFRLSEAKDDYTLPTLPKYTKILSSGPLSWKEKKEVNHIEICKPWYNKIEVPYLENQPKKHVENGMLWNIADLDDLSHFKV